ncbi:MAG: Hsp20/alpha crystallin family protein [Candidatus Liptonbacteria bacterium]|nr:Hsp20/alpha crystallin family protein [Candidatus Liptonbacteria bacterium]
MHIIKRDERPIRRFCDEGLWDSFERMPNFSFSPLRAPAFPKVDIAETEDEVKITANIPGVAPEKVEIEVNEDIISLSGTVEKEQEEKEGKVYRYEREYGEFHRMFTLPARVQSDKVAAKAKNGVLTITLPKAEAEKKKKVKVETE